jgi:hypothetical protein
MHWSMWAIYIVIVLWVAPAALRSDTAMVLLTAWGAGEAFWLVTGENLPLGLYFLLDAIAISFIISWAKGTDWLILGIYPVMWAIYALLESETAQWWSLWALSGLQFLAAGRPTYLLNLRGAINELGRSSAARSPTSRSHYLTVPPDMGAAEPPYGRTSHLKLGPDQAAFGKDR